MRENLYNEFTRDCDEYSIYKDHEEELVRNAMKTYLYDGGHLVMHNIDGVKKYHAVIRLPGATRGHLVIDPIDKKTILDIVFYDSTCFKDDIGCYFKDIITLKDKWIGKSYKE